MASNPSIDPGSNPTIPVATEEISSNHYQKIKLIDPTAASTTGHGIAANPIRVDPTGSTTQPVSGTVRVQANTAKDGSGTYYNPLVDADGHLQVDILSGGGTGGTSATDEAAFAAATTAGTPLMGARDDASTDAVAEDKLGIARITEYRALHTNIRDASGNELGTSSSPVYASAPNKTATGTLSTTGDAVTVTGLTGASTGVFRLAGAYTGTINAQLSVDGTNWVNCSVFATAGASAQTNLSAAPGTYFFACAGATAARVTASSLSSGTPTVDLSVSAGSAISFVLPGTTIAATQSGTWNINNVSGTVSLPTGASTLAEQQTQTTHLATIAGDTTDIEAAVELLDDTVATLGTDTYTEASSKGIVIGAVRRDADTTLVNTTNEFGPLQMDANGRLKVEAFSGETLPVSLTSTTITGTVAVTQSGTWDEIGINDSGNSITVDNGGTFVVQENGAALTALQLIDDAVYAEDAASANGDKGLMVLARRTGTPANTSGTDGDYESLQISAGRLWASATIDAALPTGANTIGDVTVSGNALTSLQLLDDVVLTEDAAHSSGDKGVMALSVRRDANTSLVGADGDYAPLQVDATGSLKVAIISGAGSGGTSAADDGAFSVGSGSGTPIMGLADETAPDSVDEGDVGVVRMTLTRALHVNLRDASGNELSVGGGTQYDEDAAHSTGSKVTGCGIVRKDTAASLAGTDGDYTLPIADANGKLWVNAEVTNTVTVASHAVTNAGTFVVQENGGALTALQLIDDTVFTDDAAFTPGTSKVLAVGFQCDESSTDSVDEGDVGAARMTADRRIYVTDPPRTSGGYDIFRSLDLDETEEDVKTSAGQLFGWYIFNAAASTRYVKIYNATAANVTVGTTTPVITIPVPAGSAANVEFSNGIAFSTAITAAATTAVADNDTGAPSANDVVINLFYK
jgi:hypothetical protein